MPPDSCAVLNEMKAIDTQCAAMYSSDGDDEGDYAIGWAAADASGSKPDPRFSYRPDTGASPLQYSLALYSAGGFVADLSPQRNVSLASIAQLRANNWLDQRTRLLVFELLAFNPNSGLYSFVTLAFELFAGATGMSAKLITGQMDAIRVNIYSGTNGLAILVLQIVLLIFFLVFGFKHLYSLYSSGFRKHYSVYCS